MFFRSADIVYHINTFFLLKSIKMFIYLPIFWCRSMYFFFFPVWVYRLGCCWVFAFVFFKFFIIDHFQWGTKTLKQLWSKQCTIFKGFINLFSFFYCCLSHIRIDNKILFFPLRNLYQILQKHPNYIL